MVLWKRKTATVSKIAIDKILKQQVKLTYGRDVLAKKVT